VKKRAVEVQSTSCACLFGVARSYVAPRLRHALPHTLRSHVGEHISGLRKLVEAAGVEPASENSGDPATTCFYLVLVLAGTLPRVSQWFPERGGLPCYFLKIVSSVNAVDREHRCEESFQS